jgi:hypothetical protein
LGYQLVVRADARTTLLLLAETTRLKLPGERAIVVFDDGSAPVDGDLLELADWRHASLIHTRAGGDVLRRAALGVPQVTAAVFIGGDDDAIDDHVAWQQRRLPGPVYPVGSTGGAAATLLAQSGRVGRDTNPDLRRILGQALSYPLVMHSIFEDLGTALSPGASERLA